ncbi:MAG: hypothetical protein P1P86_06530 [Bacteroidales bacterium]|nr:hypothetical protein [Bacteroidales bacterium]
MNRKPTLILLLLLLFPGIHAQPGNEIDWEYEIDLLARELAAKHPGLLSVELQQVLAAMGDAQTQVNYHFLIDKFRILPLELYWFEDGIYVLETDKQYEPALGKKLTAVNGFPLDTVIDSLATLLDNNNQSVLKNSIPRMLTWYQLPEHFGFASKEKLTLTFSGSPEKTLHVALPCKPGELVTVQPPSLPLGWQDQKSYFRDHYFENEHIYYIQYNRC